MSSCCGYYPVDNISTLPFKYRIICLRLKPNNAQCPEDSVDLSVFMRERPSCQSFFKDEMIDQLHLSEIIA